jgi:RNA polymerase sigma factor (sigma-70 family)
MTETFTPLMAEIRRLTGTGPDADLLAAYIHDRNDGAFAALVDRHGSMVWGVCRRVLGDIHAAEDAYQATFLVLARRAGQIRHGDRLAGWLYGVALRVARKARQRRHPESWSETSPEAPAASAGPLAEAASREALATLDEELERLPEVYRTPVLLCCLGGLSQEEAARRLGWSAGSVRGRLERGRARLADRLARRGISLSAVLSLDQLPALAPPALGSASPAALALANAVLGLASSKLKSLAALVLLASMTVGSFTLLAMPGAAERKEGNERVPVPQVTLRPPTETPLALDKPSDGFWGLDFSPDGKIVAGGAHDGSVRIWDATTGKQTLALELGTAVVLSVRFSHDGKTLASVSDKIRLHDPVTGKLLRELDRGKVDFHSPEPVAFSPDDRIVLGGGAESLRLWDVQTGALIRELEGSELGAATFSPDGKIVAGAIEGGVGTWDARTGQQLLRLRSENPRAMSFSPDGKFLAAGTTDRSLTLWNAATGAVVYRIEQAHVKGIVGVAFTPDGRYLVSAGKRPHAGVEPWAPDNDGEVKVRESATGKELFAFATQLSWPNGMALDPTGTRVAIGTLLGRQPVKIWSMAGK